MKQKYKGLENKIYQSLFKTLFMVKEAQESKSVGDNKTHVIDKRLK